MSTVSREHASCLLQFRGMCFCFIYFLQWFLWVTEILKSKAKVSSYNGSCWGLCRQGVEGGREFHSLWTPVGFGNSQASQAANLVIHIGNRSGGLPSKMEVMKVPKKYALMCLGFFSRCNNWRQSLLPVCIQKPPRAVCLGRVWGHDATARIITLTWAQSMLKAKYHWNCEFWLQ